MSADFKEVNSMFDKDAAALVSVPKPMSGCDAMCGVMEAGMIHTPQQAVADHPFDCFYQRVVTQDEVDGERTPLLCGEMGIVFQCR